MRITLDIPDYKSEDGLPYHWENDFQINSVLSEKEMTISANKEGLISLAIQLLTLAQDNVAPGSHFHYDSYNSLEDGSFDIIIQKSDF
jgi:hypothetical protein